MVFYLIIMRPVEILLAKEYWGESYQALYQEFLFVQNGRRMSAEDFTKILEERTLNYIDCHMGIRAYRHISIAIK